MPFLKTVTWLVPLLLGAVLGALLFYTIEIWGLGLQDVVKVLAGLAAGVLITAFGAWLFYKYAIEKLKHRHGSEFSELLSTVSQNSDLLRDPEFRRERLWPVVPTLVRVGMGWVSASFSLALGVTLIANLTLMATLAVQYLQVDRLTAQNRLLETQNQLSESTRRAALVQELSDILNEIDEELDAAEHVDRGEEAALPRLTPRLEGRINALSRSLRPYQFLEDGGVLTDRPLSPERGQLLVSLLESRIELANIWRVSNFLYSQLDDAELAGKDLSGAILFGSRFRNANLRGATLVESQLQSVDFQGANLFEANLKRAQLSLAILRDALLPEPEMLAGANLLGANLEGVRVMSQDWIQRLDGFGVIHDFNAGDWMYVNAPKLYRGGIAARWAIVRKPAQN